MKWAWLFVLAGCGRLAFDGTVGDGGGPACSAAASHDEDLDLVDDGCDVCPHMPDPGQGDDDGDGVGDACDPHPTTPGDQIVVFDSFATGLPVGWTLSDDIAVVPDGLFLDTRTTDFYIRRDTAVTSDWFEAGVTIGAKDPASNARQQLLVSLLQDSGITYYCELEGSTSAIRYKYTYSLDGSTYTVVDGTDVATPLENASFALALQQEGGLVTCHTTWPPTATVMGATPTISPVAVRVYGYGFELTLRYWLQIHSP